MQDRSYPDIIAGAALSGLGVFVAAYAATHYPLGTIRNMQAGMFPTGVGCLLAIFGLLILLPALLRRGVAPQADWRPFFSVMASVAVFALTVTSLGMIPAVVLLTFVAALAEERFNLRETAVLAVVLVALSAGIFYYGLGLQLALVRW